MHHDLAETHRRDLARISVASGNRGLIVLIRSLPLLQRVMFTSALTTVADPHTARLALTVLIAGEIARYAADLGADISIGRSQRSALQYARAVQQGLQRKLTGTLAVAAVLFVGACVTAGLGWIAALPLILLPGAQVLSGLAITHFTVKGMAAAPIGAALVWFVVGGGGLVLARQASAPMAVLCATLVTYEIGNCIGLNLFAFGARACRSVGRRVFRAGSSWRPLPWALICAQSLLLLQSRLDWLILSPAWVPAEAAGYSLCQRLLDPALIVGTSLLGSSLPRLASAALRRQGFTAYRRAVARLLRNPMAAFAALAIACQAVLWIGITWFDLPIAPSLIVGYGVLCVIRFFSSAAIFVLFSISRDRQVMTIVTTTCVVQAVWLAFCALHSISIAMALTGLALAETVSMIAYVKRITPSDQH